MPFSVNLNGAVLSPETFTMSPSTTRNANMLLKQEYVTSLLLKTRFSSSIRRIGPRLTSLKIISAISNRIFRSLM
ncbi:MAG: hypothetical protein ACQCN4_11355 [Candidatus Bathyarchaeia archaeon]